MPLAAPLSHLRTGGKLSGGPLSFFRAVAACLVVSFPAAAAAADSRFLASPGPLRFADDTAPIEASLYSLSSALFEVPEASRFLAAARAASPGRQILVVCDPPMCDALAARLGEKGVEFLPTSLRFSPWPRDPFIFARGAEGRVVLLNRPNLQPGREADARLAQWLASTLSDTPDRRWVGVRYAESPWPFHGGQLLQEDGRLWLTLHSVERRALDLLGLDRVPVESFSEPAAVDRYARAARRAAADLGDLFGRGAEFVHPMPAGAADANGPALFRRLAAGAGRDLDTYLTLLPGSSGGSIALVADLRSGDALLASASSESFEQLRITYGLGAGGEQLSRALRLAQSEDGGLADYLDLIAAEARERGLDVRRLPLLRIPTALLADRGGVVHPDFLLTWNNVVVEGGRGALRAEGFASQWTPGDEAAARVFTAAGATLELLPPLVHSIVLNGGYRCASNHLRRAE